MAPTYAVSWRNSEGARDSGRLELGPRSLRLEGTVILEILYDDVLDVSICRANGDRLGGRSTMLVTRTNGRPVWIAPVAQQAALLELHERLSALSAQ